MNIFKQVTRILGGAALAALVVGLSSPAEASPVPPTADKAMVGTWVNTDAASRSVKQLVIDPLRSGNVSVDAFGSCSPSLCEWGKVSAIVYGSSVSAKTGATFQSNQAFLSGGAEWSRKTLMGTVTTTRTGPLLTLRELTVFEDGSSRKNYTGVETFVPGEGQKPTVSGNPVTTYHRGDPPTLTSAAMGGWVPATPSGNLAKLTITGTTHYPVVHGYGQCTPSPCDWGTSRATAYGVSISDPVGGNLLAPYSFGFKNTQLMISFSDRGPREQLKVWEYNEFTDGSGRSNYTKVEVLVRA